MNHRLFASLAAAALLASCASTPRTPAFAFGEVATPVAHEAAAAPSAPAVQPEPAAPPVQDRYGPAGGESLLSLGVTLQSRETEPDVGEDTTDSTLFGQVGFGYFLADEHEIGAQFLGVLNSPDEGDDVVFLAISPYYNYNFRANPRTWWYVGPHVGLAFIDFGGESESELAYGVHVGMRQWISPDAAFFVEPRYTITEFGDTDITTFDILLGLDVAL